jgi:hypothetical protein
MSFIKNYLVLAKTEPQSSYQQKEEAVGNIKTAAMIQTCDA